MYGMFNSIGFVAFHSIYLHMSVYISQSVESKKNTHKQHETPQYYGGKEAAKTHTHTRANSIQKKTA